MDDDSYLAQIRHQDLKKRYSKEIKEEIKRTNSGFFETRPELEKDYSRQFDTEKEHDRIINTCVYPFVERGLPVASLGYRFIRAAPLLEFKTKNIDFLVYRREGKRHIAIFGEVKGSITNFSQTLKEMADRRKVIESHLDYIKNRYLDTSSDPICEYVLAVKSSLAAKMRDTILESEERVILWQVDYLHHKLSLVPAPRQQPDRRMMTHADSELTGILGDGDGISSYENTFAFYPQSHILAKLLATLQVLDQDGSNNILKPFKLRQYVNEQLSYLDSDGQQKEVDCIIEELERINFAAKIPESPDLLIASRSRVRASLEAELKKKWMKSRLDEIWTSKVEEARRNLQAITMEEQRKRPTLFPDDDATHMS